MKLSIWQKEKIDKIINKLPKKAWNDPVTMEKIYTQTINALEPASSTIKPNLNIRKRKVEIQETILEEADRTDEGTNNEKNIWRTTKKTRIIYPNQSKNDMQDLGDNQQRMNNIYEHLLSTQDDDNESVTIERNQVNKRIRPPPIYATSTSLSKIIEVLKKSETNKNNFHLKQRNDSNVIIFAHDITTYDSIKKVLTENNTQFFTYTPKHRKPKSLILKGIRGNPTADEFKEELIGMNLKNVNIMKVAKINYNKSDPNKYHYSIQLSNDSIIKEVTNIKYIAYQQIRWEKPRKKSIVQCRKCQRLSHVSYSWPRLPVLCNE